MIKELLGMSMQNSKKTKYFIFAQFTFTFFLLIFCSNSLSRISHSVDVLNNTANKMYKVNDNFWGQDEVSFFDQKSNLSILKSLFEWETNNPSFEFAVGSGQYGYVLDINFPDIFLVGYENSNIIGKGIYKNLQVNSKFIEKNNLSVYKGRLFTEKDYNLSTDNKISVLMGYDYKDYIQLNDYFTISYLGINLECKVIGFLNEGNYYSNGFNIRTVDRYIVMPSLEFSHAPIDEIQKRFELKLYLDKTSGYLYSNNTAFSLQQMFNEKCIDLDIPPYRLENIPNFYISVWGLEGDQLKRLFLLYTILIVAVSIINISLTIAATIVKLKKNYSICVVNGMSKNTVYAAIILEIFFSNTIALLTAIFLHCMIMGSISHLFYIVLLYFIVCLASCAYPIYMIKQLNLSKMLREDY